MPERRQQAERAVDQIFSAADMFPLLNIDFITSAMLSTDGDFERALPLLLTENQIAVERDRAEKTRAKLRASPAAPAWKPKSPRAQRRPSRGPS